MCGKKHHRINQLPSTFTTLESTTVFRPAVATRKRTTCVSSQYSNLRQQQTVQTAPRNSRSATTVNSLCRRGYIKRTPHTGESVRCYILDPTYRPAVIHLSVVPTSIILQMGQYGVQLGGVTYLCIVCRLLHPLMWICDEES